MDKSHNVLSRGVSHHLQLTSLDLSHWPHREKTDDDATAISSSLIPIDLHEKNLSEVSSGRKSLLLEA